MTNFEIESDFTLRVQAWAQPDEATALRRFGLVRDLLVERDEVANISVWRILAPSTGTWVVVVCGRPEHLVEVEGEPYDLGREAAAQFVMRRLAVAESGHALGFDEVAQFASYGPDGAVLENGIAVTLTQEVE